jgi:hypothetical protein
VTIVSEHLIQTADAALVGLERRQANRVPLPLPFGERVSDRPPPRTDFERWLQERVLCTFCRRDFKEEQPDWRRISFPESHRGQIICAYCISDCGFTGCELYCESASYCSHVVNVFGLDEPPEDWQYLVPGWVQVADAFAHGPETYIPIIRASIVE